MTTNSTVTEGRKKHNLLSSLQGKLLGAFLVASALTLAVGLVGYFQIISVRDSLTEMTTVQANAQYNAILLGSSVAAVSNAAADYSLVRQDPALKEAFTEADKETRSILQELKTWTRSTNEEQERWNSIAAGYEGFFMAARSRINERDNLGTADKDFETDTLKIKDLRGKIKGLVLQKGSPEVERDYWQMGYREKEFVFQYKDDKIRKELEVDAATLRKTLISSELPTATKSQVIELLDEYAKILDRMSGILQRQNASRQALTQAITESDRTAGSVVGMVESLAKFESARLEEVQALANDRVKTAVLTLIGLVAAALVIGLFLSFWLAKMFTRPISQLAMAADQIANTDLVGLAHALGAMAKGDLTQSISIQTKALSINSKDELGNLAWSFNQMIASLQETGRTFSEMSEKLRYLIDQVTNEANELGLASGQLTTIASGARVSTQRIASTIQQVAKGAVEQTDLMTRTASSVSQMAHAVDSVASGAQEQAAAVRTYTDITAEINTAVGQVVSNAQAGARGSAEAAQSARAGADTIQQTIEGMDAVKAKVGLSAEKVKEMGARSEQIGAIILTIDDIADQTNLLALNAAIEAARAGEQGRGFAVVASEVRKLAERASLATKEIGAQIAGIQSIVADAVSAMDDGVKEVEAGALRANEAEQALVSILKSAETVNQQVDGILASAQRMTTLSESLVGTVASVSIVVEQNNAATEQMAASSSEVMIAVENVANLSEENSSAAEEVSTTSKEMAANVEEVVVSAEALARVAENLREVVSQFKADEKSAVGQVINRRRDSDWADDKGLPEKPSWVTAN